MTRGDRSCPVIAIARRRKSRDESGRGVFGGDGVAVLGLLPNPEPVHIDGRIYLTVLVPTAPIPVGGGLLYVPAEWVKPADFGIDTLTSVYLSMGITLPRGKIPRSVGE